MLHSETEDDVYRDCQFSRRFELEFVEAKREVGSVFDLGERA